MTSSEIIYHIPGVFSEQHTTSLFTLSNRDNYHADRQIKGFNLGLNTSEDVEVINQNRQLLAKLIGGSAEDLCYMKQVHGTSVGYAFEGGFQGEMDGLCTDIPGLALCIQVADCAAVLLADEGNRIIGAVHAGWRGAVNGVLDNIINRMVDLGAEPSRMKAWLSPCISLASFEVGREVAEQFPERFVERDRFEKPHVDLPSYIGWKLTDLGLERSLIETDGSCTMKDQKYYSYRREGSSSGRMMGVIKINNSES